MKEYFSHDFNARNDPELQRVLLKLGHEGKSVYWDLVEMLYENGGFLFLSQCEVYAFALHTKPELIQSLVKDFNLFKTKGDRFYSDSVIKRMNKRIEKSEKARRSAMQRWGVENETVEEEPQSEPIADVEQPLCERIETGCEGNAIKEKESKVKESKVKKIKENKSLFFTLLKETFLELYHQKTGQDYYFSAKDAGQLAQLEKKLEHSIKTSGKTPDEQIMRDSLRVMVLSHGQRWIDDNLSISIINSKYNEIVAAIRQRRGGGALSGIKAELLEQLRTQTSGETTEGG